MNRIQESKLIVALEETWIIQAKRASDFSWHFGFGAAYNPKTVDAIANLISRGYKIKIEGADAGTIKVLTVHETTDPRVRPERTEIECAVTELGNFNEGQRNQIQQIVQLLEDVVEPKVLGAGICLRLECEPPFDNDCPLGNIPTCDCPNPIGEIMCRPFTEHSD